MATIIMAPGANENGFASMLSTLIRQNLDERPEKLRSFERMAGRVTLVVEDLAMTVTMHFERGRMTVYDGVVGIPDVTVRAPSELVTQMSLMELEPRFKLLPDPRGENTKAILEASRLGKMEMHGTLTHLPLVLRLTQVMSVAA